MNLIDMVKVLKVDVASGTAEGVYSIDEMLDDLPDEVLGQVVMAVSALQVIPSAIGKAVASALMVQVINARAERGTLDRCESEDGAPAEVLRNLAESDGMSDLVQLANHPSSAPMLAQTLVVLLAQSMSTYSYFRTGGEGQSFVEFLDESFGSQGCMAAGDAAEHRAACGMPGGDPEALAEQVGMFVEVVKAVMATRGLDVSDLSFWGHGDDVAPDADPDAEKERRENLLRGLFGDEHKED